MVAKKVSPYARLWNTGYELRIQGHFDLAKDIFLEIEKSLNTNPTTSEEKINVLNELAICNRAQGEFEQAMKVSFESLHLSTNVKYLHGQSEALHNLGVLSQMSGAFDDALAYFRKSMKINEELDNTESSKNIARSLIYIGIITQHQEGKLDKAEGDFHSAYRLFRMNTDLESKLGTLRVMIQLANSKLLKEFHQEALELYKEALELALKLKNKFRYSLIHRMMALTYWMIDSDYAEDEFKKSLTEAVHLGQRINELSIIKMWVGIFYWTKNNTEKSYDYLSESLSHLNLTKNHQLNSKNLFYLILLSAELMKPDLINRYQNLLEDLWKQTKKSSKKPYIDTLLQIKFCRVLKEQTIASDKGYSFGVIRKYENVLRLARRNHQEDMALLIYPYLFDLLISDSNQSQSLTLLQQAQRDLITHSTLYYYFKIVEALIELYFKLDFSNAIEKIKQSQNYFKNKGKASLTQQLNDLISIKGLNFSKKLKDILALSQSNSKDNKFKSLNSIVLNFQIEVKKEISDYLRLFKFNILLYKHILPQI